MDNAAIILCLFGTCGLFYQIGRRIGWLSARKEMLGMLNDAHVSMQHMHTVGTALKEENDILRARVSVLMAQVEAHLREDKP